MPQYEYSNTETIFVIVGTISIPVVFAQDVFFVQVFNVDQTNVVYVDENGNRLINAVGTPVFPLIALGIGLPTTINRLVVQAKGLHVVSAGANTDVIFVGRY